MLEGRDVFMREFPRHDPMPRLHLSYNSGILKDFAEWNPSIPSK